MSSVSTVRVMFDSGNSNEIHLNKCTLKLSLSLTQKEVVGNKMKNCSPSSNGPSLQTFTRCQSAKYAVYYTKNDLKVRISLAVH